MKRALFTAGVVLAGGCTFGGLADYEVKSCPAVQSAADDVCASKLQGPDDCHPYQCDAQLHRCVARARDDDRDGDPSPACGGRDCDDHDPTRATTKVETCNGIDDDCNGLVDDGFAYAPSTVATLPSSYGAGLARVVGDGATATGAAIAGGAIEIARVTDTAFATQTIATPGDASEQPYAAIVDGHVVVAYAASDATCQSGRLSVRTDGGGSIAQLCAARDRGVVGPAIAAFPTRTGAGAALVALFDETVARGTDPSASCDIAVGAPLLVASLTGAATTPALGAFAKLAPDAIALRPPALARLDGYGSVLVAAASATQVIVWSVTPDMNAAKVAAIDLAGAKSVAMAVSPDLDHTQIAIVAEVGCAPKQQLRGAFGTASGVAALPDGGLAPPTVTFGAPVDLTAAAARAGAPAVGWIATPGEWLVTWLGDSGARARRIAPDGRAIDPGSDLGSTLGALAPRSANTRAHEVVALDTTAKKWTRVALSCP